MAKMTYEEALKIIGSFMPDTRIDSTDKLNALMRGTEALETQIPKKPTTDKVYKNGDYYVCPVCNRGIIEGTAYCSICGQAIDWSDCI